MSTIETEHPKINQQAIPISDSEFRAGDLTTEGQDARADIAEVQEAAPGEETVERTPIDVSDALEQEFKFGGPNNPTRQKWLDENGIKPGEHVVVRVEDQNGELVERTVSTDPNTFFTPVDKLVNIPTDEFEHAEIIPKKYPVGTPVVVEVNIKDAEGNNTGVKPEFEGWKVVGYGTRENGTKFTTVRKIGETEYFDKDINDTKLEALQTKYSPESRRPPVSAAEAHRMGHQELESAGIVEPQPKAVEPNEARQELPETQRTPQTPQEKYDAAKKKLADFIQASQLTDLDVYYLEQYATTDHKQHDILVTKMSSKSKELTDKFKILYDEKQRLRHG